MNSRYVNPAMIAPYRIGISVSIVERPASCSTGASVPLRIRSEMLAPMQPAKKANQKSKPNRFTSNQSLTSKSSRIVTTRLI